MHGSTSSSRGLRGTTRRRVPGIPATRPTTAENGGASRPAGQTAAVTTATTAATTPPHPRAGSAGRRRFEHAIAHLTQFTGQPIEGVSSLNRTRDGGWRVVLEALELERIPRTTDILASYAVELDDHGELMGYERIHRYYRNDVDGDQ